MIYLYSPVSHGPHEWYCVHVFDQSEVWMDFFNCTFVHSGKHSELQRICDLDEWMRRQDQ